MFNIEAIREQVSDFIDTLPPDVITVGLLRFGAHLPHIGARMGKAKKRRRTNLMLSHMVEFFTADEIAGRDFLILDDTMYRGASMDKAVARLVSCGVSPKRIKTAAVVVHERCKRRVDFRAATLPHHEYVEWKEELTAVVRNDVRPTERDHPLYYFDAPSFVLGKFITELQQIGMLQPAHFEGSPNLLRFTITLDKGLIHDVMGWRGIEIIDPLKIKIHCMMNPTKGTARLTFVPVAPSIITVPDFLNSEASATLEGLLKLEEGFFTAVHKRTNVDAANAAVYYFVSRGIAALMFLRFLAVFHREGYTALASLAPEGVDDPVRYFFPPTYEQFHAAIYSGIAGIVASPPTNSPSLQQPELFSSDQTSNTQYRELPVDPILPQSTLVLEFLDRKYRAAEFRDGAWEPSEQASVGVTHRDLLDEFEDPEFIATAVDDLLDYGLLRAVDTPLTADKSTYGRWLLPGGEYKAIEVTRIADAWRNTVPPDIERMCEEEAVELWGSNSPGTVATG